jgi:hypothetical protein
VRVAVHTTSKYLVILAKTLPGVEKVRCVCVCVCVCVRARVCV